MSKRSRAKRASSDEPMTAPPETPQATPATTATPARAEDELTADAVRERLRPIEDPEMALSIVELGLVRDIHVSADHLQVDLTLTSPMCPWGPELVATVRSKLSEMAPAKQPIVELVWEPPWDPAVDPTEDARAELGIWT